MDEKILLQCEPLKTYCPQCDMHFIGPPTCRCYAGASIGERLTVLEENLESLRGAIIEMGQALIEFAEQLKELSPHELALRPTYPGWDCEPAQTQNMSLSGITARLKADRCICGASAGAIHGCTGPKK